MVSGRGARGQKDHLWSVDSTSATPGNHGHIQWATKLSPSPCLPSFLSLQLCPILSQDGSDLCPWPGLPKHSSGCLVTSLPCVLPHLRQTLPCPLLALEHPTSLFTPFLAYRQNFCLVGLWEISREMMKNAPGAWTLQPRRQGGSKWVAAGRGHV